MHKPTRFIALEGIDGSGTTTQLALLAAHLRAQGHRVTQTAEPSSGPIGQRCREALSTQPPLDDGVLALLFAADRLDHVARCIKPALSAGGVVLCDRYLMSSLAYQGLSLPQPWLCAINERSLRPDATVLLEVPVDVAQQRVAARGGTVEQFDALELQRRISLRYKALAEAPPPLMGPIFCLDGAAPQAEVAQRVAQLVDGLLALGAAP